MLFTLISSMYTLQLNAMDVIMSLTQLCSYVGMLAPSNADDWSVTLLYATQQTSKRSIYQYFNDV
ncbi:unnamed protein product [Ceratitis capitata]|uniref:(Mediterranean fruit fly) hypothetical protein n=1 Tax=Ceratitis capitata TaxID=7213 RepID=A0A811U8C0_CERCA|nr:unnamed protein product [Ceratitis capitata]